MKPSQTLAVLGLVVVSALAASACTPESAGSGDVQSEVRADLVAPQAGGGLGFPVPSKDGKILKPATLDKSVVLPAMKLAQKTFYNGKDYMGKPLVSGFNADEARQCLNACPDYYSDIMCHFYCWMPSYSSVPTNIRGCFTQIARGTQQGTIGTALLYPQIYDYCTYLPYDAVNNPTNVYPPLKGAAAYDASLVGKPIAWNAASQAQIAKNKAAHIKPGVNAWVDDNIAAAFKNVAFTWYDPFLYSVESQQETLNEFYGVKLKNPAYGPGDAADVAACKMARRRTAQDNGYTAAGKAAVPDGMECSTAKDYKSAHATPHPNRDAIVKFMASSDPSLQ